MIITSNNPKHKMLGKKLEVSVRRMALLSQFVQIQRTASGKLAAMLEDYEDNADVFEDLKEEIEIMESALNTLRGSLASASNLFDKYRDYFEKLDRELQKLTRKKEEKEPIPSKRPDHPLPPIKGVPPLQVPVQSMSEG